MYISVSSNSDEIEYEHASAAFEDEQQSVKELPKVGNRVDIENDGHSGVQSVGTKAAVSLPVLAYDFVHTVIMILYHHILKQFWILWTESMPML